MAYEWLSFKLKSQGGWGVGRGMDSMWRGLIVLTQHDDMMAKVTAKVTGWEDDAAPTFLPSVKQTPAPTCGSRSSFFQVFWHFIARRVSPLSDPRFTVETPTSVNSRVTFPSAPAMMDNSLTDKRHILSTHREKVVFSLAHAGCTGRHRAPVHCEPWEACFGRRSNSCLAWKRL